MGPKKSMLVIWAVASLLWLGFSGYMFHVDKVGHAYRMYDRYLEKAVGKYNSEPHRKAYYRRAYDRATKDLYAANRDLGLFFLVGIGFPGLMLAIGTMLLENAYKPALPKKS